MSRRLSKMELSKLLGVDKNRLSEWLSQAELLSVRAIDSHAAEEPQFNDICPLLVNLSQGV